MCQGVALVQCLAKLTEIEVTGLYTVNYPVHSMYKVELYKVEQP